MSNRELHKWEEMIRDDPEHSHRYARRFREIADSGGDIYGEARLIDAMVPRGSRILDAGCGAGRTGGYLHRQGHTVVGVDLDPVLITAAEQDYPGPTWLQADLSELDLPARGIGDGFDVIVSAGNVMRFVAPSTRVEVLRRLGAHLRRTEAGAGRLVVGFGAGAGYEYAEFASDAGAAGLVFEGRFATWDLRPFHDDASFLVAILGVPD